MAGLTWADDGKRFRMYRFAPPIEQDLKRLNVSDNWHAGLAWGQDLLWMAACVAAVQLVSWWLYPVAVLLIGARQRGLSTILHDCAHGVGVADRRLQMVMGTVLTAYPIFQQHYAYKVSHVFTHHPKLGNPERDPDLEFFIEQKVYAPAPAGRYFRHIVIWPALGARTAAYLRYLVRNRFRVLANRSAVTLVGKSVPRRKRTLDRAGFWVFWAAVGVVAWQLGLVVDVLLFWVVPYLTSFQILGWYIELSEHTPLVRHHHLDLYMTRNRKSRGLEKLLTGIHHDHYHLEHHLDPRTPFWNLAKAREVRLRDATYAALDARTGGLVTKGPEGQPSAISAILAMMVEQSEVDRAAA